MGVDLAPGKKRMNSPDKQGQDLGAPTSQDSPGGTPQSSEVFLIMRLISDVKETLGEIKSALRSQDDRLKIIEARIDCVDDKVSTVRRWMHIAIGVIVASCVVGGFLIDQFGDKIVQALVR